MNSSKKSILNSNFTYLAAFVLPVIIMMALYYTRGIFPWGNECYLRSDMYHQYAPFFSELWHKIRNGESLTYSWDIGMGTNFTSLFAYYLASPSNWFVALFPQKYTIEIMNAFIILKIAGSSAPGSGRSGGCRSRRSGGTAAGGEGSSSCHGAADGQERTTCDLFHGIFLQIGPGTRPASLIVLLWERPYCSAFPPEAATIHGQNAGKTLGAGPGFCKELVNWR